LNHNRCATSEMPSLDASKRRGMPHDPPEVLERFHQALPLVRSIVQQFRRSFAWPVDTDELKAYGQAGLLEAARRYDADRAVPFGAFARFRIRGAILDGIRASAKLPRRRLRATTFSEVAGNESSADDECRRHQDLASMATAIATGMLFDASHDDDGDAIAIDRSGSPEEQYQRNELVELVLQAVERLPASEALVIRGLYFQDRHLDSIAAELRSSIASTSRMHTRAIRRLTVRLADLPPSVCVRRAAVRDFARTGDSDRTLTAMSPALA
jgi:RNA polymerase sigma factor for flagellar operon FliA